jgi:hypothetical protein
MSHEGIRIVNAEQAAEETARDKARGYGGDLPKLSVSAVTPLKVRVKKTEGTGVEIDWHDGHQSAFTFPRPSRRTRIRLRCTSRRPSRWRCCRLGSTRSSSSGAMGTRAGSIRGTSCGGCVRARRAKPRKRFRDDVERE